MKRRDRWRKSSGLSKTVTILAALLILQIGLCISTDSTVMPAYVAIFGRGNDSELGLGLVIWQGILGLGTFFILVLVGLVRLAVRHANENEEEKHDR